MQSWVKKQLKRYPLISVVIAVFIWVLLDLYKADDKDGILSNIVGAAKMAVAMGGILATLPSIAYFAPYFEKINTITEETAKIQAILGAVSSNAKKTIRIGIFDDLVLYLPLYVAIENKYFEEEDLDVIIVKRTKSDIKTAQMMYSGQIDFGFGDPFLICSCSNETGSEGPKPTLLFPLVKRADFQLIRTFASSRFDSKSSDPIRIATHSQGSTAFVLGNKLKDVFEDNENNAKWKLDRVDIDPSILDSKMLKGWIEGFDAETGWDVLMAWEPLASLLLKKRGQFRSWSPVVNGDTQLVKMAQKKFTMSACMVSSRFHEADPGACGGVFKALSRASMNIQLVEKCGDDSQKKKLHELLAKEKSVLQLKTSETDDRTMAVSAGTQGAILRDTFYVFDSFDSYKNYDSELRACLLQMRYAYALNEDEIPQRWGGWFNSQ